jgi:type I restriction enzyme, S subunit
MSELPRGWVEAALGQVTTKIGSGATPTGGEQSYKVSGIPLIRSLNVHFDGVRAEGLAFLDEKQAAKLNNVIVEADDVLLNITGASIGRVAVAPCDYGGARVNQHVSIIRLVQEVLPRYVCSFLASPVAQDIITHVNYGATRQALTKSTIEDFAFPLPSLAEQKRIVAKLDALNAKSASARTELARIETLVSRYKQAVLSKAFSGDSIGVKVQERLLLSEVIALRTGPFGSALHKSDYIVGGVPLVNPMHIVKGKIEVDLKTSVATTKAEQLQEFRLKAGDVVLARRGEMGRAAVVGEAEDGYLCGTGSMIVRPSPILSPIYLQRYLSSPPVVMALESAAVGTTMVNLNQSILLSQTIPIPSIEEQHEIVRRIESAFAKIDRLAQEAKRALELVGRLNEAILAKAFRGELVPQDDNDEPAELLLARIRAERETAPITTRKRRPKA